MARGGSAGAGPSVAILLACVAVGALVAAGQAAVATALVLAATFAAVMIHQRRELAPVLWGAVAFTAPLHGVRAGSVLALSDVLTATAFLMILPEALGRRRRVVPRSALVAFAAAISAGLVGTFFAPDFGASMANLVRILLGTAGTVTAMALWDPGLDRLRRFAWLWFAGAVASAAWAAATPRTFNGRALGLTDHPNHLGLVSMLGIGLGLGLVLSHGGRARLWAAGGVVLLALAVGLSGSRAALLGLAAAIGLTALLTRKIRLLIATGLVVSLALVGVILGMVELPEANAVSRAAGRGGSAASDVERKQVAAEAFSRISRNPLTGQGFEFAQDAHNIYLQALVVGGPLALVSFVWLSGRLGWVGLQASRATRRGRDGPVIAGLTAGYASYLCTGTFWNIVWHRYLWTYVGLLLLLAASTRRAARADAADSVSEAAPAS